jgi:hypothetical protein
VRVFVLYFSESGASIWLCEKLLVLAGLRPHLMKFVIVPRSLRFLDPLI